MQNAHLRLGWLEYQRSSGNLCRCCSDQDASACERRRKAHNPFNLGETAASPLA
jgi:hypothetical protein